MKAIPGLLFILFLFSFELQSQVVEMSPMPERVTNNAVVEGYVNGVPYMYSFAGLDSTKIYSGIHLRSFRYNTETDIWDTIPSLPDNMGKIAAGASRIGDIIYIIGGYHVFSNGSEVSSDKVHRFNTQTNEYLSDGAPIPVPIDDQVQAVWRDSLIYVVTGWSNTENVTNVQIYNPATDEWTVGTPVPGTNIYPAFGASGSICGDSIFYFGGARNSTFSIERVIRKGIINPDDPTEITWSASLLEDPDIKAYRAASMSTLTLFNACGIRWIGGSDNTYNYDGIAYNNGQGVEPNHRILFYFPGFDYYNLYQTQTFDEFPMDLRGIATFGDTVQYICGGMENGQSVSNRTFRMGEFSLLVNTLEPEENEFSITLFPNPVEESLNIKIEDDDCSFVDLKVFDETGILVLLQKNVSCNSTLDISKLPTGIYQLSIFSKGKYSSRKFIKLR